MPTYYNGKEITSTSKLSGLSLAGKSSIKIGGRDVTLSREMRVYGDSGSGGTAGYSNSNGACIVGNAGYEILVFISVDKDTYLFKDKNLTIPLVDGYYFTDDTTEIGGGRGSFFILIQGGGGAISGRATACSSSVEYRFSGSSGSSGTTGYGGNENACTLGPMSGQGEFVLYGAPGEEFSPGLQLYDDVELTSPVRSVPPGIYYNLDTNQSVQLNRGIVDTVIPCG